MSARRSPWRGRPLRDVGPLRVEFAPRGWVQLLAPVYFPAVRGAPPVVCPTGTHSDGGTIPPVAWWLVGHPYSASMLPQYLAHDVELARGVAPWTAWRRLGARCRWRGIGRVRTALVLAGVGAWIVAAPAWRWVARSVTRARATR